MFAIEETSLFDLILIIRIPGSRAKEVKRFAVEVVFPAV
jgi:hypothetical protein